MTEIFDFTKCPENPRKSYLGANGSKKCLCCWSYVKA